MLNFAVPNLNLELTDILTIGKIVPWAKQNDRLAPCGAPLVLAPPPDGKGERTFQCFDCDRPDPLKTDRALGRLDGELGSEK